VSFWFRGYGPRLRGDWNALSMSQQLCTCTLILRVWCGWWFVFGVLDLVLVFRVLRIEDSISSLGSRFLGYRIQVLGFRVLGVGFRSLVLGLRLGLGERVEESFCNALDV
jgi:hypothetical protein